MKTWFIMCEDGEIFTGIENKWEDVLNHSSPIAAFTLLNGDQSITMPTNCIDYSQSKTASCNMAGDNVEIESHNLEGLFVGSGIVRIKVALMEKTGDINITLEDMDPIK